MNLCTYCSSARTVPLYLLLLSVYCSSVPLFLCAYFSPVPQYPLFLYTCAYCSPVPLHALFLCIPTAPQYQLFLCSSIPLYILLPWFSIPVPTAPLFLCIYCSSVPTVPLHKLLLCQLLCTLCTTSSLSFCPLQLSRLTLWINRVSFRYWRDH